MKQVTSPILFLDFDGVIVTPPNFRSANPACMAELNRIIDNTGAVVVVSSCWRDGKGGAKRYLKRWGFKGRVVGETARLPCIEDGLVINGERGSEIVAWMVDHNLSYTGHPIAILDDGADMGPVKPYLIQTEFRSGLTPEKADSVISQLHRGDSVL